MSPNLPTGPPLIALDGLVQGILLQLEELPFPTIAPLNGHALGGGGNWLWRVTCASRFPMR
jgi:enoyl-CoA hydratase/carnithine racemase